MRSRAYRKGELEAEGFPLAEVSDYLATPDTIVWVDLCDPNHEELEQLKDELGLHELAVEDALEPHQRPKLDHYDEHFFLSCHMVDLAADRVTLVKTEIDAFVGDRWFITVRKGKDVDIDAVVKRWDRSTDLATCGVPYLLYGLLDVVADSYFKVLDQFDEYYEDVSEALFDEHPLDPGSQRQRFQARQSLVHIHRLVNGLREAVSSLLRRNDAVPAALDPYFQDVYDHLLRAGEMTDTLRELVTSIVETNLTLRDFRQNQVMKQVTSWAAIIAVPTLITGYYGMNVRYPGINTTWGFLVSVALLIGCSLALFMVFRKKGWL
jgi:magnesium transporter